MAALTKLFRVIRYDRRGHGKSSVPPGPYSIELLGKDALAILDDLNIGRVHWCGLSIGGMVGQWLAANAPERFDRIVLASTSSFFPDQTNWDKRLDIVRQGGLAPIANSVIASWFTRDFREREPEIVKRVREMLLATSVEGYIGASQAIAGMDNREFLPRIKSPTLVIAGRHDPSTPARYERIRPQPHSRSQPDDPGILASVQYRDIARFHRGAGRLSDAALRPRRAKVQD